MIGYAPEDKCPRKGRGKSFTAQRDRGERAEQAPGPNGGRQVSHLRSPALKHPVGDYDDQHVQAPAHERLRDDGEKGGRDEKRRRSGREDCSDIGECDQHPGAEWAEQSTEALDRR
jgi:hypothetical protein